MCLVFSLLLPHLDRLPVALGKLVVSVQRHAQQAQVGPDLSVLAVESVGLRERDFALLEVLELKKVCYTYFNGSTRIQQVFIIVLVAFSLIFSRMTLIRHVL